MNKLIDRTSLTRPTSKCCTGNKLPWQISLMLVTTISQEGCYIELSPWTRSWTQLDALVCSLSAGPHVAMQRRCGILHENIHGMPHGALRPHHQCVRKRIVWPGPKSTMNFKCWGNRIKCFMENCTALLAATKRIKICHRNNNRRSSTLQNHSKSA